MKKIDSAGVIFTLVSLILTIIYAPILADYTALENRGRTAFELLKNFGSGGNNDVCHQLAANNDFLDPTLNRTLIAIASIVSLLVFLTSAAFCHGQAKKTENTGLVGSSLINLLVWGLAAGPAWCIFALYGIPRLQTEQAEKAFKALTDACQTTMLGSALDSCKVMSRTGSDYYQLMKKSKCISRINDFFSTVVPDEMSTYKLIVGFMIAVSAVGLLIVGTAVFDEPGDGQDLNGTRIMPA